jgi:DNA-binding transcriptional MerR regulator
MGEEIEISQSELYEFLTDTNIKGQNRFTQDQIEYILKIAHLIDHTFISILREKGFNMYQIRYLLKLFSEK